MNTDFASVLALKRVLESASDGMGVARSVARELREVSPLGMESARLILLGYPLATALRPLLESRSEEISMLASLIVSAPRSSSKVIGRSGGVLADILERWVRTKESWKLQQKALGFRSLVTCGVLGAVTAMVASLGPLVSSLNFSAASPVAGTGAFVYAAAAFTGVSSSMLGIFMSGRGFYLNVVVALGVFGVVSAIASPLANISTVTLWGVK